MRKIFLEPNFVITFRLICLACTLIFSFTLNVYSIGFLSLTLGINVI